MKALFKIIYLQIAGVALARQHFLTTLDKSATCQTPSAN